METCPLAKDGQGGPDQGDAETLLIRGCSLTIVWYTLPPSGVEVSKFESRGFLLNLKRKKVNAVQCVHSWIPINPCFSAYI
jgi:hypothetical protein